MPSHNLSTSGSTKVLEASASVSQESSSGNYRRIHLTLNVRAIDYSGARQGSYSVSCSDAGINNSSSCSISGSDITIFDESFDVYVAPGQTSASINFSFTAKVYSSSAAAWKTISGTITTIYGLSMVSDVSISGASDTYFGSNCNISWWATSGSFYYKLKFIMSPGDYSHMTGAIHPGSEGSYSYTGLTIPLSAAKNIPNDTSATMTVTLYQYSNSSCSTLVGSPASTTFTVKLGDDIIPSIATTNIWVDNSESSVVNSWRVALMGYSKLGVSASASGIYGSTIQSFTIEGEYSATVVGSSLNYVGEIVRSSGNKKFTLKCKDSRGRVSSSVYTNEIAVLAYAPPNIDVLSMSKSDDSKFIVSVKWAHASVNGNNSSTGVLYYKSTSATNWVVYGEIQNNSSTKLTNIATDELASYNFRVIVTDAIGNSSQKESFASTRQVLLDFKAGGKGLGIGKICEADALEVSMDAKFYNNIYIGTQKLDEYTKSIINMAYVRDMLYPVGSIYVSTSATSPASLFGGSWSQITNRFLLAAGSSYTAGKTGGASTVTLTVDQIPSHSHNFYCGPVMARYPNFDSGPNWPPTYDSTKMNGGLIASTGGGQSHNNMPPYLVVYMWKRVS